MSTKAPPDVLGRSHGGRAQMIRFDECGQWGQSALRPAGTVAVQTHQQIASVAPGCVYQDRLSLGSQPNEHMSD
ncbi:hypothetical protein NDU88_008225 [Pleurodeles waltl]|uniref:Uncharacterized protein n=1 Tax=Pleurodeles waltl TaxID=8319 RepID=A0AAV7NVK9_PLEWA|nr:hypothetical protein NDU88_008225 [Pleurodeles waltl]